MRLDSGQLELTTVQRRFDAVASSFDTADFVHRKTCDGLLERLEPMQVDANVILDLGAATGKGGRTLKKVYRTATIINFDISSEMLKIALRNRSILSRYNPILVQGDAARIPLRDGCVDLVFCNQMLPWVDDLVSCFLEIRRILKPNGVFIFATLGPDTMSEIRAAYQPRKIYSYPDMHDVGDALVRAGLSDPVLDIDRLKVTFSSAAAFANDLEACGASQNLSAHKLSLKTCRRNTVSIEVELVYGHAWGAGQRLKTDEYLLDPTSIGRLKRP